MKLLAWSLMAMVLFPFACDRQDAAREHFLLDALQRRPGMEIQDYYKLLYQGRFGIGHLISSREAAREYLLAEIADLPESDDEPLLEPCSPDGHMVRVNLRPFIRSGLDPERLLDAMLASLSATHPDTTALRSDWEVVGALIRKGRMPGDVALYREFTRKVIAARFPALHHSEGYTARYHPAYRVVLRDKFLQFCPQRGH
ncbi:MAG TPA: hypothetical protein PLG50_08755 [bacterium]|nr:hypothetical protein [bacterium]HQG45734.1 hypothetical protein [bacterium]HQI49268.1 hypothetical protein [bacterium]HQJ63654.1 hypothetical protein [bacterium]